MTTPTIRVLSLGAGVQSTTLALLAVEDVLPKPDAAIFADTGWEPRAVYDHLARLTTVLVGAGIPVHRAQHGDLRRDTVETTSFMRLPAFVQGADGRAAMLRRQCTERYKMDPIRRQIRLLLGARTSTVGSVLTPPAGATAEQWVGFSTDEVGRIKDHDEPAYLRTRYPLIELGMSREDCTRWLGARGWTVAKSACIGCPFHGNRQWRDLRDNHPDEWADAVEFDRAIRERTFKGPQGVPFLHRSLLPLDQVDLRTSAEHAQAAGQFSLFEDGDPDGCSPYGCRSGLPTEAAS
jgi:hypothetical protein